LTASHEIDVVVEAGAVLGEGPVWADDALWWVDIEEHRIHRTDPRIGEDVVATTDGPVGFVIPRAAGGWVAGLRDGISIVVPGGREMHRVAIEAADIDSRMNDGKCDPSGRLFAGTMSHDGRHSSLYRVDADWSVSTVFTGIGISNGLGWSPDTTRMYYIDTPTMRVDVIDYDEATGEVEHRRPLIAVAPGDGFPDGMTVDVDGCLWVAFWDGWCVRRYDPEGHLMLTLELPVSRVTSCTFGGDQLDQLFITSASTGLSEAERAVQPLAGAVFRSDVGTRGRPADYFAG
jgi:sugar lactone lactonase YvrE